MFTVTVDHTHLKGVLEWIIDQLGTMNGDLTKLDRLLKSKVDQVDRNATGVSKNADDIAQLQRMVKDLEAKSQDDENRVREMNVNVENLNMNVSLQHRTVLGLVEDHKELIDQHTKEIDELKNKAPVAMPEIKGDFDMGELMKIFASKTPPDNTIKRIEALEDQMADVNARLNNLNTNIDLPDLLRRVQSLETRADKSDRRLDQDEDTLADHERRIKALESMDLSAGAPSGELDTASILKQLNLVR